MAYDSRANRMRRQNAVGMDELVKQFIREMRLSSGLNRQRVDDAWNQVSGASRYTLSTNFVDGTLYCTLSSSIVRNQLYFQKDFILKEINDFLKKDDLFTWDWDGKGDCVKLLVLK